MRLAMSSWSVGLVFAVLACDNSASTTLPGAGCGVGQEICNGQCVPAGTCPSNSGSGGATDTATGTSPGNGGATNSAAGGQAPTTGGTPVVATGGTSTANGGSATGGSKPATGGTSAATGGTKATGGSVATGGTVASNPDVCDDTSKNSLTMSSQYSQAFLSTQDSGKSYVAITNWWSKFTDQTVKVQGLGFTITNSADAGGSGAPVGFPSIFIGKYQQNASTGSNLPVQVSSIKSIPTVFDSNATTLDTGNFNATYDVWLTSSGTVLSDTASSPGGSGVMLMVWMYKPGNRSPRGTISGPNHAVSGVDGSWNVWVDPNAGGTSPTVSYVSTTARSSLTFDLNKFLQDAVTNNYLVKSTMYLSVVFGGFEVWSGGNGAQLKNFCVKVNK